MRFNVGSAAHTSLFNLDDLPATKVNEGYGGCLSLDLRFAPGQRSADRLPRLAQKPHHYRDFLIIPVISPIRATMSATSLPKKDFKKDLDMIASDSL
jgi:hypothetical protein